jgi:putative peptide zinc metalloprotease protein
VEALLAKPQAAVVRGQPLLRLVNPELELELAGTRARLDEVDARLLKSMKDEAADLAPLARFRESVSQQLKKLTQDSERLIVRAPHDGVWAAPGIEDFVGRWVNRGTDLGLLVNPAAFEFVSTVMQEDADALFSPNLRGASVQLYGDGGTKLPVARWRVIPGEQKTLPSAALGWKAGGDIAVSAEDNYGNKAEEPFFEVLGHVESKDGVLLLDGRSGRIKFSLPADPLLPRWTRRVWQLLQKRYQI